MISVKDPQNSLFPMFKLSILNVQPLVTVFCDSHFRSRKNGCFLG